VREARQRVADNPQDPTAHLALADLLQSTGLDRLAVGEYLRSAELFLDKGANLDAALAAMQAFYLSGGPAEAEPPIENLAVQAAFLAADNPGIVPVLTEANKRIPDWPSLPSIAARAALYLKQDGEADRWLGIALDRQPGDPLARAVRAEALYLRGEPVQAQAFARQILEQPRLPEWLILHLNRMIEKPPVR
jgi:tetratricopeptide (TPR) repeat protein